MRLVHFSDVHVQVDYRQESWLGLGWRRWAALLEMYGFQRYKRYVNAEPSLAALARAVQEQGADHAILSGDLTAMALEEEFRRARAALGELAEIPRRFTVIPGNHDVYAPDAARNRRFEKYFGHLLVSDLPEYRREGDFPFIRLLGDEVAVVGLCSARLPLMPGAALGWIGQPQLDGLVRATQDSRLDGRMIFVTVHHAPLAPSGKPDCPAHRLLDWRELLDALPGERYAVLCGHIHKRYQHPSNGIRPHVFCAGSSTAKGNEGYWVYDVKAGKLADARKIRLDV